jgi:hypothetical protein
MKNTTHKTLKILALAALIPQLSFASEERQSGRPTSPCERIYGQIQKGFQERRGEDPSKDINDAFSSCRSAEDQMMQSGMSSDLKSQAENAMRSMIENAEEVLGPRPRTEAKSEKQQFQNEIPTFQNHH